MAGFNKTISFLLGLVVVIVFFAVVTGKVNLKDKLTFLRRQKNIQTNKPIEENKIIKPTPIVPKTKPVANRHQEEENGSQPPVDNLKTIPATGLPTLALPLLTTATVVGFYIKKRW